MGLEFVHGEKRQSEEKCNQENLSTLDLCPSPLPSASKRLVASDTLGVPSFFMKWFKHESSACKDEVVRSLIDSCGIESYGIFMVLLELCAEKIDKDLNTKVVSGWPFIEYLTRSRRSTVRRVIATCASLGLLVDESTNLQMVCSVPNLLKRLDNWTQDFQAASKKVSIEQEEEREVKKKNIRIEEVKAYFHELNSPLEAEAFFDYFSSNGWKVGGRAPMKDWRAAARNWVRRIKTEKQTNYLTKPQQSTIEKAKEFLSGERDVSKGRRPSVKGIPFQGV